MSVELLCCGFRIYGLGRGAIGTSPSCVVVQANDRTVLRPDEARALAAKLIYAADKADEDSE
jgi:hypothetical protein